jgi:hypothetical protein
MFQFVNLLFVFCIFDLSKSFFASSLIHIANNQTLVNVTEITDRQTNLQSLNSTLLSQIKENTDWKVNISALHNHESNKIAIIVTSVVKEFTLFHWMAKLFQHNITVYIISDNSNNNSLYMVKKHNHPIAYSLSINENEAKFNQFFGVDILTKKKSVVALDKSLYFMCRVAPHYDFVWFIENDVYIPSVDTFLSLNDRVIRSDLVSGEMFQYTNSWPLYGHFDLHLPKPWFHAMMCATGMSRKMLSVVDTYVRTQGNLEFLEGLFPTLAYQNNMTTLQPKEFKTVVYRNDWTCNDILKYANNWFHPIKNQKEFVGDCILSGEWNDRVINH